MRVSVSGLRRAWPSSRVSRRCWAVGLMEHDLSAARHIRGDDSVLKDGEETCGRLVVTCRGFGRYAVRDGEFCASSRVASRGLCWRPRHRCPLTLAAGEE